MYIASDHCASIGTVYTATECLSIKVVSLVLLVFCSLLDSLGLSVMCAVLEFGASSTQTCALTLVGVLLIRVMLRFSDSASSIWTCALSCSGTGGSSLGSGFRLVENCGIGDSSNS